MMKPDSTRNIYFAGSIAGGRNYLSTYQDIVAYLKQKGFSVLTEHVAFPDVMNHESDLTPEIIFQRDMDWLDSCDFMVAEVTTPSLGVGFEVCRALEREKKVLCLYKEGIYLSRMLLGNSSPYIAVCSYRTPEEWQQHIDRFIDSRDLPAAEHP